jgi:membrane protease YdiL (CAAX protease family)
MIIYRILGLIINAVAMLLTISLVFSIPMWVSSSLTLLSAFLMVAVILYAWYSFKFYREVLLQQKTVKHRLKDMVRVNGIVTLVFSVITFLNVSYLLKNPALFTDSIKNLGVQMPLKNITGFFYAMLIYAAILFIHVVWTFALLKKNKDYFQ